MRLNLVKDLDVYKKSYQLAMKIFKISKSFPAEEKFALTNQIRRSSRSVCLNLRDPHRTRVEVFCVYAILSEKRGRIYIGQTVNFDSRLRAHNQGRVASTAADRPWSLVKQQFFSTRNEARWFEVCLKRSRGRRLRWLAKGPGLRAKGDFRPVGPTARRGKEKV